MSVPRIPEPNPALVHHVRSTGCGWVLVLLAFALVLLGSAMF
jgi:hypothetical protein